MNDPMTWWAVFGQGVLTGVGLGLAASFAISFIATVVLMRKAWREESQ